MLNIFGNTVLCIMQGIISAPDLYEHRLGGFRVFNFGAHQSNKSAAITRITPHPRRILIKNCLGSFPDGPIAPTIAGLLALSTSACRAAFFLWTTSFVRQPRTDAGNGAYIDGCPSRSYAGCQLLRACALGYDGEEQISVQHCDCVYVHYAVAEDYTNKVDLLRCNPEFGTNDEERYDCLNPNTLNFARMLYVFRCRMPGAVKREEVITLICLFRHAQWKPKTLWENCRILEDGRTIEQTTFYLNDAVDADWFLEPVINCILRSIHSTKKVDHISVG
ncbi:hypothetical protein GGX14DRAFT_674795 [Mycena pura]|uniref:Uncharacterized protein n=1 Tax=Mycena pura TaxID=153505 RepID=A0AAD6Y5Z7_9AGAR|nr:hypothetical protein GGX14DRAFT_674795 [Mycena pura]